MKRISTPYTILRIMMILTSAICFSTASAAQEYENTPVTVSKEKIRVDGQVCYSHIVLEKQTLFSISKAYNVSIEDIYRYNPSVREEGLKKNSILIIPVIKQQDTEKPAINEGLQKTKGRRITHTVKWYEDIESIALKYGVGVNALMKANNLTDRKLSKRQKLIIPEAGESPEEEDAVTDGSSAAEEVADTVFTSDTLTQQITGKEEINMSLLLPFKATGATCSVQNMDFYSGVLLAVHDMKQKGITTNLNVYDTAEGAFPSAHEIKESDVIIGPVASGDIAVVLENVRGIKGLVSPLDPRAESLARSRKSLIHAPTPHSVQYNDLVSWIREDRKHGDELLFITEKGARRTDAVNSMTVAIDSSGLRYKSLSYSILEGRDITETLTSMMSDSTVNRVYIASESEAFVNDVVRNLNVMIHQKYNVVLYAPSKIRSFETIEVENFHNTNMRVCTGYYIDYNSPEVKDFLLQYRALFNTEPTQFAYQGYDLAMYFIGICSKYGDRWTKHIDTEKARMLQSTYDFAPAEEGGYINNGVRRIVYGKNWSIESVR